MKSKIEKYLDEEFLPSVKKVSNSEYKKHLKSMKVKIEELEKIDINKDPRKVVTLINELGSYMVNLKSLSYSTGHMSWNNYINLHNNLHRED